METGNCPSNCPSIILVNPAFPPITNLSPRYFAEYGFDEEEEEEVEAVVHEIPSELYA